MRTRSSTLFALGLIAALLGPALPSAAAERAAASRPGARPGASARTLDELAGRAFGSYRPDGRYQWQRTFREPMAWEDYIAALAAEDPDSVGARGLVADVAPAAGTAPVHALTGTCVSPDDDYDGDGFTLTTNPPDLFPLRQGEFVADRPRIKAFFTSFIEADVAYRFEGDQTLHHETERVDESELSIQTDVIETREFRKEFNGSFGLKLGFARGQKPTIGLDLGLGGEVERKESYTWTRTTMRRVSQTYRDLMSLQENQVITVGPNDGWVRGQVTVYNLSDYALDADVSDLRIAVVAYSPFTGAKSVLGDVAIDGSYLLGFGEGNNYASTSVELPSLNTADMMQRLSEGWIFDMEIASYSAVDASTGQNLTTLISNVNQRNARISIHYGDATTRQYGQVSVFRPDDGCLTAKEMLEEYVGAANVEFERMVDGTLIVKRINHREIRHWDRDFDSLTPTEQSEYGRWIVGFDFYTQPLTEIDLETTLLAPEDKVFFYYITAADFADDDPPADETAAFAVANDGSSPVSQWVLPVSIGDRVGLNVDTDFQIYEPYTQYVDDVYVSGCGFIYNATYYGTRVQYDSNLHNIPVPDADWYGMQVDFGGQGWRSIQSLLDDPAADAAVSSFRGFPYYDYVVEFDATEGMLGSYATRNLQVRDNRPRQTFSIGYEGWNVAGQHVVCRSNTTVGYFRNHGDADLWYRVDNFDDDGDKFYDEANSGIDFNDVDDHRFPFSPEHLDGIDNDGDGPIDEEPLLCPPGLPSYGSGICELDNRLGWYPPGTVVSFETRERHADGSVSGWIPAGSGTSYAMTMTAAPDVTSIEIRSTRNNHSGINVVNHAGGGSLPTFSTEVDFEAEDGLIGAPMQIDTGDGATYVHVPQGTDPPGGSALYQIDIPAADTYVIWTRVYATDQTDDSFLVELFDPSGQPVDFGFGGTAHHRLELTDPPYGYNGFDWTRVGHWNAYTVPEERAIPIFYQLGAGVHTLQIRPRELGTRLDKLRVERWCPDADGDGWTTCAGDCNDGNGAVHPGRSEVCSTAYDDDCDGYVNEGCGGSGSVVYKKQEVQQQLP